jgi:glucokinase
VPQKTEFIVGLDVGGTNIVAGCMPDDGSLQIAVRSEPTRADQGADAVVDRIVLLAETVMAETMAATGAKRADFL